MCAFSKKLNARRETTRSDESIGDDNDDNDVAVLVCWKGGTRHKTRAIRTQTGIVAGIIINVRCVYMYIYIMYTNKLRINAN